MTISLEQHIDELRAELSNACDTHERREIRGELDFALAELAVTVAEQTGAVDPKPPF